MFTLSVQNISEGIAKAREVSLWKYDTKQAANKSLAEYIRVYAMKKYYNGYVNYQHNILIEKNY